MFQEVHEIIIVILFFVMFCLTDLIPGTEPGGRMSCVISSKSSVSATLELIYADESNRLIFSGVIVHAGH